MFQQKRDLTSWKKANEYLARVYSHVTQDVVLRLDKAFTAFFKRIARYPRFRKFGRYGSMTYPDAYNGSVKLGTSEKNPKLYLSKVGYVPIVVHRDPPEGINKRCTVKKESNKWYAVLEYEVPDPPAPPAPELAPVTRPLGIDLGLKSVISTTEGKHVKPAKPLKAHEKRLKHLQRNLSRTQKGSKNRVKAIVALNQEHQKVAAIRRDVNHKLSRELVNEHDLIVLEDLRVKNMVKNHCVAKSIHDVAWSQLTGFIQYKGARDGRLVVLVSPQYTSMDCSECGHRQEMALDVRTYSCPVCGNTMDRDVNAARNILERGLLQVGRDTTELKPVENGVRLGQRTAPAQPFYEPGTTSKRVG